MPPGLPHRPPLAMRLWLFRRSRKGQGNGEEIGSATSGPRRSPSRTMSIESLEHMVRSRVRMFLRHTWLVSILGTAVIVALVWAAFYLAREADHIRVAAGPLDGKFVQALSDQLAKQHRDLHLQLVATDGATDTAEAMSKNRADFAILPSNLDDSLNWPVVAILRQNVMALIVPAPVAAKKGKKAAKIEKIDQLSGRRVGIVTGSEATKGLLELVLSHYGVALAKVTVTEIDPKNVVDAVKSNQIDALFVAGVATGQAISSTVSAATRDGDAPTFLAIDQADGIAKRHPALIRSISTPVPSVAIRRRRTTVSKA